MSEDDKMIVLCVIGAHFRKVINDERGRSNAI